MAKIVNFCQLMFKLGKGVGAASRRHRFLGDGKGDRSFGDGDGDRSFGDGDGERSLCFRQY